MTKGVEMSDLWVDIDKMLRDLRFAVMLLKANSWFFVIKFAQKDKSFYICKP